MKMFLFKVFEAWEITGDKTSQEEFHQLMQNLCTPKVPGQIWKSGFSELHYHIASSGIFLIVSGSLHVYLDIT